MLRSLMGHFRAGRDETVMIGDTVYDLRMDHAAGTSTCAVTYGFHPVADLHAEEPAHVVDHPRELPGVLLTP